MSNSLPFQKGHNLYFPCKSCKSAVNFSIFELEKDNGSLTCEQCKQSYLFSDEQLRKQLKQFESLCRTIKESEEILGNASIGVQVGSNEVKIPFKILLTRLNSTLDLLIGGEKLAISFRLEPVNI